MGKNTVTGNEIAPGPERTDEQSRREKAAEFLASHEETSFAYDEENAILCWGSSFAIMTACTSFRSLMAMRSVLGCFEAMIAPCCVAFTQTWWRRSEQTMRTSYWRAMNGVTLMIGRLFTYGLGHNDSANMVKYQIIFLFCGLLTVASSVIVFILIPDSPMEARFLSDRERVIARERLRANQMGITSRKWRCPPSQL